MKLPCNHHPEYYFISTEEPILQKLSYSSFLFNDPVFFINSSGYKKKFFYIINKKNSGIEGRLNLAVIENSGFSTYKTPFGGIEFKKELKPEILKEFLNFIEQDCKNSDISSLIIKLYPEVYHKENVPLLINALISSGFTIQFAELNQHIQINERPITDKIHYSERKRIKKCLNAGFKFELEELDKLQQGYLVIKESRDRKGYPTSMTFHELESTMIKFPDNYLFFSVKDGDRIIALSISILVTENIIYNFYHAHDAKYDSFSPVTMVVKGVYEYCQSRKIEILDLGISTDKNILNAGLFRFKKNLDAQTSLKYSFKKEL